MGQMFTVRTCTEHVDLKFEIIWMTSSRGRLGQQECGLTSRTQNDGNCVEHILVSHVRRFRICSPECMFHFYPFFTQLSVESVLCSSRRGFHHVSSQGGWMNSPCAPVRSRRAECIRSVCICRALGEMERSVGSGIQRMERTKGGSVGLTHCLGILLPKSQADDRGDHSDLGGQIFLQTYLRYPEISWGKIGVFQLFMKIGGLCQVLSLLPGAVTVTGPALV